MAGDYELMLKEEEEETGGVGLFSNLWSIGKSFFESDIPSDIAETTGDYAQIVGGYVPESVKQGGAIVGNKLWNAVMYLDKLRGGAAGAWDVLGEHGPKFTRNAETGEYEWVDQHQSVMEDRTLLERLKQGIAEGTLDPASKDFSDEFRDLVPPEVWEQSAGILPLGKILEFASTVTPNIGGDPLTYIPSRWVSVPFKLIAGAIKDPISKVAKVGPVQSVLEAFNVHVGDAAEAQKIINDLRLEQRGEDILAGREKAVLEERLAAVALKSGVSVPELKSAITEAIETGDMALISRHGADTVKFAGDEIKFYEDVLAAEKAAGRNISDIRARGLDEAGYIKGLDVKGYMPHVAGRQFDDTFNKKIIRLLSPKIPAQYRRELEGTIREINEQAGRQFFLDDPLILHAMRRRWSSQALAADRMFIKATEFGVKVNPKKKGFDVHGNPIPNEWMTLNGYAFPKDFHRIIAKQDDILRNPAKAKAYVKFFDTVQNWWKKYTLGLRPAWHTRNAFGNVWNAYLIGGLTNPAKYGQAAAIQKAMQVGKGKVVGQTDLILGKVTGKTVDKDFIVPGTGLSREELFNEAVKRGVYESGLYGQELGEAALRQSNIPGHTQWSGINKAFAAGKAVENNARLALFIDGIEKGIKQAAKKGGKVDSEAILDAASMNVRRALFDYSDLSHFEKTVMKRAAPFYTWTRKNLPAQLRAIVEHPDRANKLNILIGAMQKDVGKIDSNDVDEWVKDQFPIFLNAQDSEDTYTFVTAVSYLPTAELNRLFQDPEGLASMFGQMGTPLLKVPLELIMNYDTFRRKKIDPSQKGPFTGKFGEGFFKIGKGSQDFLGLQVTPKQKHLLQSLVLLGEIDRLNPFNIFGDREGGKKSWAGTARHGRDILESSRWIRAALGVRIYKRGKGEAVTRKALNFASDIIYLQEKLKEPKAIMNEELRQHLLRQMRELQSAGIND